jgi:TonB-dependent starch-binding outer membrane protein SusC
MKKFQNQKRLACPRRLQKITACILMMIFSILAGVPALAQDKTVTGRVTNERNEPIPNASVIVKGTSTGTTSDNNGNFSIVVPDRAVLVVSSVNYAEREVTVGSSNRVTVQLTATGDLGEVVVIGYGTARKKDVTGSTVSVRGETLNEVKAPNVINQLQGRAAGVDIVTNGNQIGTGGQIRIRGNRSMTGNNDPLIVVDGMAYGGSVNDISPDNVASIDILKDASASAIYGSRGANGVIIISTKRGMNQRATTSYNGFVGIVNAIDKYRLFNGEEYAHWMRQ